MSDATNHKPPIIVAALYCFTPLTDFRELRASLLECCQDNEIQGTLLLASEGINGTIAGTREGIDAVTAFLHADGRFGRMEYKESYADSRPFYRMKVKLKKEIVTMGVPDTDPNHLVGTYLDAKAWNELIADPDVLVIDTRNEYEIEIGTFQNAISPNTKTFREFPEYVEQELADKKDKKIAMFCTGGIRCEKATSYLKSQSFDQVYHLQGGILRYLETVEPDENLWEGECFVFDNRVSVDKNLEVGSYDQCHACRRPISDEDKASPHYQPGVSCPHCIEAIPAARRQRFAERQRQIEIAKARGEKHIGRMSTPTPEKLPNESE